MENKIKLIETLDVSYIPEGMSQMEFLSNYKQFGIALVEDKQNELRKELNTIKESFNSLIETVLKAEVNYFKELEKHTKDFGHSISIVDVKKIINKRKPKIHPRGHGNFGFTISLDNSEV